MPPFSLPSSPSTSLVWRAAAAEAAMVAGGEVAGVVGAAVTRNSLTDLRGEHGPLWAPGTDSLGKMAAYMAIGTLPVAVPFALAAALTPKAIVRAHPLHVVAAGNLLLLGAFPAALAVGFAGLEHQSPPHAPLVASLLGTVIFIGMELATGLALFFVLSCAYASPHARARLPQNVREWFERMEQEMHGAQRTLQDEAQQQAAAQTHAQRERMRRHRQQTMMPVISLEPYPQR